MKFVGYQSQCKRYQDLCLIYLYLVWNPEKEINIFYIFRIKLVIRKIVSNYNEINYCSYFMPVLPNFIMLIVG